MSILREIIMVIVTACAAIAAIFSAIGVFRQENVTYTTALYVKEVDKNRLAAERDDDEKDEYHG